MCKVQDMEQEGYEDVKALYGSVAVLLEGEGGTWKYKDMTRMLGNALHSTPVTPPDLTELTSRLFIESCTLERANISQERLQAEEEAALLGITPPSTPQRNLLMEGVEHGVGMGYGLQHVLLSDASGIEVVTPGCTGLYPFMAAAVGVRTDLDTVYGLLRGVDGGVGGYGVLEGCVPVGWVYEEERRGQGRGGDKGACRCVVS